MNDQIAVDIADGVQVLRFDRPEKNNAITSAMYEALADALAFGESSSRVRCFLIAGIPGMFTAGNDIGELRSFAEDGALGAPTQMAIFTLAAARDADGT